MGPHSLGEGEGANYIFGYKEVYWEIMFELINEEVEIFGNGLDVRSRRVDLRIIPQVLV